jgi:hypothetical protein
MAIATDSVVPVNKHPNKGSSGSQVNAQDELVALFQECCQIIDQLADSDDHDSADSDKKLYDSKVSNIPVLCVLSPFLLFSAC